MPEPSSGGGAPDGEADPQHGLLMLVLLVLVFFATGLAGFLLCRVLKQKGYRCRTSSEEPDPRQPLAQPPDAHAALLGDYTDDRLSEEPPQPDGLGPDDDEDLNQDTVEKIVKCIIQNEANVEVLKEMLGESDADPPPPLPVPSALCPHRSSQDGGIPHHHTVHLGSTQAPCIHCSKKKRPPMQRQGRSKESKSKMHPGETTVFSVGRFRVTHIEKKPTSHESQEGSFHENKPDAADADQKTYSHEQLQRTGSQNGLVRAGGVQGRRPTQPESEGPPEEAAADDSTRSETHLNLIAHADTAISEREGGHPKACSSQGAVRSAVSGAAETDATSGPKGLPPEEPGEESTAEQVGHQGAACEVSDNKQGQVPVGPKLEMCPVEQVA